MVPPMVSAIGLAIGIDSCSNIIAQLLRAWRRDVPFVFDAALFARFVFLSAFVIEPLNYFWLGWLEKIFPSWKTVRRRPQKPLASLDPAGEAVELQERNGKLKEEDVEERGQHHVQEEEVLIRDWKNIWTRWFVDCVSIGATWNILAFLLVMGLLLGKTLGEILFDMRHEFIVMLVNSWKVWPVGGFFNMAFVPVERRLVVYSLMGLIWNIYLSLVAARL